MADTPKSPLDELNSALDAMDIPSVAPEATPLETPSDEKKPNTEEVVEAIEVGGRLWTSVEDLDKSYRFVQSERSKAQKALTDRDNEFKKYQEDHREAIEMSEYFRNNPEVHEKVRDFFQKVISGEETPKQAIKSSGLSRQSPEIKEILEWKAQMQAERQAQLDEAADKELDTEITQLRKEYKLDDEKLDQVLQAAAKFNKNLDNLDDWVPLRDIYLMLSSKHAWRKAPKVQDTALPTPRSETIAPTSPPRQKTPEDELMQTLDKMGL